MHAHDSPVDLRRPVLRLGDEVPLRRPGARPRSTSCMKVNSGVAAARCDRVAAVRLEGPLQAVDSPAGTGSRATHQAIVRTARTPLQQPMDVPVTMTRERRSQKHTEGGAPANGTWRSRRATLRWVYTMREIVLFTVLEVSMLTEHA
jgi:hypothetical protein